MQLVLRYLRPYVGRISFQFLIKFSGTITDLLLPWLLSYIIDQVIPMGSMQYVLVWGGIMILCAAATFLLNVCANRMATQISRNVTRTLRHDLFQKVTALSSRQMDFFTVPSLVSRLTADTYFVHQMVDRMQRLGVRAPILLLGGILMTLTLDPILTLVLVLTLPLLGVVIYFISAKGVPLYRTVQRCLDSLTRYVQETMTGIRVIKALSKTQYERERFDGANQALAQQEQKASSIMAISNPVMNLLLNVGLTVVIVVGAYRVNAGLTQPGAIIAFLSYFTIILNALMMVTRMFVMYSKGVASASRIQEVFQTPEEPVLAPPSPVQEASPAHIQFKNVSFSYNHIRNNLNQVSFSLQKGQTLGVIGATGSGKTTLVYLLMRLYDADSGEIRINGQDIKSIPPEILHTMFGVVFQNDFFLTDTIRANVDFGRELNDMQIMDALEAAQAQFVKERQQGTEDPLSIRGNNLSGGQRQRLLIARALAADPPILVLDDCSSALDYRTDAELRKALHRKFTDATKVIVTQRISSIQHADEILVLEDGFVIGQGTHAQLLETCAVYRDIYQTQMGEVA